MLPNNPVETIETYAVDPSYIEKPGETSGSYDEGVVPLDTLPAAWWNWLWNQITLNEGRTVTALNNLFAEITAVLTEAGISPLTTDTTQLKQAIYALSQRIATSSVAGAVKSSTTNGKVSVDRATGKMTANGLGNVSNLTTTAKLTVVAAINEIHSVVGANANAIADIVNKIGDLTTVTGNPATVAAGLQALHGSISSLSSNAINSINSLNSSVASLSSSLSNSSEWNANSGWKNSSANWNNGYSSASSAYTRLTANSANWNKGYNSGTAAYDKVTGSSANWNKGYSSASSAYSSVNASSANWNNGYSSASSAYSSVNGSSANWNNGYSSASSAYSSVNASSANWNKYTVGIAAHYILTRTQTLPGIIYTSAAGNISLTTVSAPYKDNSVLVTIGGENYAIHWANNSIPCILISLKPNSPSGWATSAIAVAQLCQSAASGASAYDKVTGSSANWNNGYSSASSAYTRLTANSANWGKYTAGTAAYSKVTGSSASWNSAYSWLTSTVEVVAGEYAGAGQFQARTLSVALSEYLKGKRTTASTLNNSVWALSGAPMVYAYFTSVNYISTEAMQNLRASAYAASKAISDSSASWNSGYSSGTSASKAVSNSSASWNSAYTRATLAYDKVSKSSATWNNASTAGSWTGSSASWDSGYKGYTALTASALSIPVGNAYSTRANIWIE